jgi:cyclopropane-fatty-acyl-phospholipid synthase
MASFLLDPGALAQNPSRNSGMFALHGLVAALRRCWRVGNLTVIGPDSSIHRIDGGESGVDARLEIYNGRFFRRILGGGDIGFADSFVAGEWDTPDIAKLLSAMSANFDHMADILSGNLVLRLVNALMHAVNRNSRSGSRRNIHAHYDLGNDFYSRWLDPGMNYSSGLYLDGSRDLLSAQAAKHAALAQAMDLREGQRVLEIGCGWGDFARFAAIEYGAKITAITVSQAQHDHTARMIQAQGLNDRVKVRLCDYRDLEGQFDRIASIEMFKAVGEAYWPVYLDRVKALLTPDGRVGLQIITIRNDLFEGYRRRPDFIQLNIFPGGMLPSERRLQHETDRAGFSWTSIRRFGLDYAETLAAWTRRYIEQDHAIRAQGFDARFDRLWRYYLAYCQAAFTTGRTDVIQLSLAKA